LLQAQRHVLGLEATEPFRINGDQVSGAVKYDGEHDPIDANCHDKAATNEPLLQLAGT